MRAMADCTRKWFKRGLTSEWKRFAGEITANGSATSANPTDENAFDHPERIAPKTSSLRSASETFRDTFPRWSLTILRVAAP